MSRPRRKKKSAAARVRPFWFLLIILAGAAAFGGYYAATWPGFNPAHVTVSGNRVVSARSIAQAAHILSDRNVWLQNTAAAAARVTQIPYIKTASVHRTLPAGVHIEVTERKPYANVRIGAREVLADADLRVLRDAPQPGLPSIAVKGSSAPAPGAFLKQTDARALLADYQTLAQAHVIVTSLAYDKFGDLVASMHGGVMLLLGDDADLQKKAPLIAPILSQVAASGRRVAAVDLRAPGTPVVRYAK